MTTTPQQLQQLSVYAPAAVARQAFENPGWQPGGSGRHFQAATLLAEISGLTPPATEPDAQELTSLLNQIFEALITTAELYGGRVVKIGGANLSLLWPASPDAPATAGWQAVAAAFAMHAAVAAVTAGQHRFAPQLKIGVSAGPVLETHAGGVYGRWEYVLAGLPVTRMHQAKSLANATEIVVDAAIWQAINGQSQLPATASLPEPGYALGQALAPNFYRVTNLWGRVATQPPAPLNWAQLAPDDTAKAQAILRSYVPGAIFNLLDQPTLPTQLSPMTICYINFEGLDYANDPAAGTKLSQFTRDAQEIIYFYEGSVNKLSVTEAGSVLLALFGAPPFRHDDDEIRAVACALGLKKAAARHHLTVKIGLAAGPVWAGPLGAPQRREYNIIGAAVNQAAAVMQCAHPQEVWLDETVQTRAAGFFEFDALNGLGLFRAIREKEQEQPTAAYLLTPLAGRDRELEHIDRLINRVWAGYGQALLLSGEAGVGKSRLAGEIVRRWLDLGGAPHSGDCTSYGHQTPYLPWRGIVSSIVGLSPRLSVEQQLARLETTLGGLPLPTLSPGSSVAENYWQERLPLLAGILGLDCADTDLTRNFTETLRRDNIFATIRAIVLAEARQRPTLVLLEDIHWSDELSLDLAADLAAEIATAPVFLVLVHRPWEGQVPTAYNRLQTMGSTANLPVSELDSDASLSLVKNKLGVAAIPPALADLILRKGQGNPFFTEELVNALQSWGVIKIEAGHCQVTGNLDELELPDTVQEMVLARFKRLDEAEKQTLTVAAAIGRAFQRDLLETVHPQALPQHLVRLQAADFIRPENQENNNNLIFKHVITQEVAYETLPAARQNHLHTSIGRALEQRYTNRTGEIIDLLAFHFTRSDDRPKALHYLQLAAQKALTGHANQAAIGYFTEALAVAHEIDDVKVPYLLLAGREQAYNQLGNRAAQAADLAEMERLARSQNNPLQLIETGNRRIQLATNLGEYHTALSVAQKTLALAQQHQHLLWEARTLTNMGITCWRQGDYHQARDCMQAALRHEDSWDDPQLKATSLNYLGLIHSQTSEYELASAAYRQALELYRATGARGGEAGCANNIGLLESSVGHYQQAEKFYNHALVICHAIGDRLREGISLNTLGQVNTFLGNFKEAKEQLSHSLSIRQAIGDRRGEAFCLHDLGYLYLLSGSPDDAISMFRSACNLRHELGEFGNYVASLAALGEAHLTKGDVFLAQHCLEQAVTFINQGSGCGEYPPQHVWWMHSQVCRIVGQSEEADAALQQAYALVKAKADHLLDPELKRSYLENVRVNAAIMADLAAQEEFYSDDDDSDFADFL